MSNCFHKTILVFNKVQVRSLLSSLSSSWNPTSGVGQFLFVFVRRIYTRLYQQTDRNVSAVSSLIYQLRST